ncbi:MAG: exodeoxyribonuclease III [Gammaproteobacteria bacterium]
MSITLASWNVNSVRARMPQIETWLTSRPNDILALQETKVTDPLFPAEDFRAQGFTSVFRGQPAYNGVAILSRKPIGPVEDELDPAFPDRRFLLASTAFGFHLVNLYAPNGESLESEKFRYKCAWYAALIERIRGLLRIHPSLALVGDFNLAPADCDVYDPEAFRGSVLTDARIRCFLAEFEALGLVDAFRYQHPDATAYSWWDYRKGSARRGEGLRIDLILLSQALLPRLRHSGIAEEIRSLPRPSDHAPVWVELDS